MDVQQQPTSSDQPTGGEPRRERYNTQFLVDNFSKDERRTRMIILGIFAALMVAGGIGVFTTAQNAPEARPAAEGAAAAEAHKAASPEAAAKPTPDAAKPTAPAAGVVEKK